MNSRVNPDVVEFYGEIYGFYLWMSSESMGHTWLLFESTAFIVVVIE